MNQASPGGQVVIVTGAGQGIGRAEALAFARLGSRVVVNDVAVEHADAVVSEIAKLGGRAVASYDSVATAEGGAAIVDLALSRYGTVDVVVNNAGFLRPALFEDLTVANIEEIIDVHLKAAFFVTQPAWRVMKSNGYGRVVMTGSSAGMFGQGANSNYCAAKGGVFGLTRALAVEGADHGIGVNLVLPFASTTISASNPIPGISVQRERYGGSYDGRLAERRTVDSVAPLVAYLGSPECSLSGEVFSACAGRYARVFVGIGRGWTAPDVDLVSPSTISEHLSEIRVAEPYIEPENIFAEVAEVARAL
ncbi:SDR family NAD(P)-dependent oxidoreductase [Rhodococcus jostii]|uniref:SDR family NAD(P)-dependent oxidoreductase n=1 Tax=Rhodococcus jostii TaxID=132919 RepID=UPI0009350A7C|nr:SDR family NAD(P)-dependent oxidoreductase [Rhodococcus jostii]